MATKCTTKYSLKPEVTHLACWAHARRYFEKALAQDQKRASYVLSDIQKLYAIENKIRPVALGRKNYLFAGSHNGAQRTAMFYTFFACCKLNNVNPEKWLNKVLDVIADYPCNKLHDLFPGVLEV